MPLLHNSHTDQQSVEIVHDLNKLHDFNIQDDSREENRLVGELRETGRLNILYLLGKSVFSCVKLKGLVCCPNYCWFFHMATN